MARLSRLAGVPLVAAASLISGLLAERRARRRDAKIQADGRNIRVDGKSVRVYESGPLESSAPVIVLLPGSGDTAESWSLVRETLSQSRRVLTYDRPGMGHSGPGPASDLSAVIEELDAVLSAAGTAFPVALVGHSFGGLIARAYTAAHPQRVAALVLVDATPPVIANDPAVRAGFLVSAALAKVLKLLAPVGLTRVLLAVGAMPLYPEQRSFRRAATPEAYRRWIAAVDANFAGNAGKELGAVLHAASHFNNLGSAPPAVPVAVVYSCAYGTRWEQMQRDVATEMHASAVHPTNARHHNIQMSSPDLVTQAINDALAASASIIDRR